MYNILCPKCKHALQISRKQLKKKRHNVTCSECKLQFNPHTILTAQKTKSQAPETRIPEPLIPEITTLIKAPSQALKEPEVPSEPEVETYSWQETKPMFRSDRWLIGSILCICLLTYQVYYFKGYSLSQNPQIRPWLSSISKKINYPLPVYRNLAEFTVVGSSLNPINAKTYQVQISLINHAEFEQRSPDILVTLHNLYGGIFAQRLFTPQEYLSQERTAILIKSSAPADINFFINVPEQEISGYSIDLK